MVGSINDSKKKESSSILAFDQEIVQLQRNIGLFFQRRRISPVISGLLIVIDPILGHSDHDISSSQYKHHEASSRSLLEQTMDHFGNYLFLNFHLLGTNHR